MMGKLALFLFGFGFRYWIGLCLLVVGVAKVKAFIPPPGELALKQCPRTGSRCLYLASQQKSIFNNIPPNTINESTQDPSPLFRHEDILWRIGPIPEKTSFWEMIQWKVSTNIRRFQCQFTGDPLPLIVCPPFGDQLLLEAILKDDDNTPTQRIGRFGITCRRGPLVPLMDQTVQDIYNIRIDDTNRDNFGVAAIIYMFVEPNHRGRGLGTIALQVISLIHANHLECDFTILVADDKSKEGTLVQWYEQHGFQTAPLLQEMMGSPQGQYGIAMITQNNKKGSDFFDPTKDGCSIQWW